MPVNKITADQFAARLNTGIKNRNSSYDVDVGPIPDIIVQPTAQVLERQNDRIRTISQLINLNQSEQFDDVDVENFVYNEVLTRSVGGRSSGTVTFARATPPDVDKTVQRNFPIGTIPDESTGETVIFVTTEEKTMPAATAPSYFNLETGMYELEVAVQCTVSGSIGEVGADKIIRPLRPLSDFDYVTNKSRTSPAVERESNNDLLERYKISILGTQLAPRNGMQLFIESKFPDAGDILVVNSDDPLVTRTGIDGNAVDIFINGAQSTIRQDTLQFIGLGQLISFLYQPIINIIDIPGYVLGTDYEFVKDTSGVSNSIRALDGIKFIAGGSSPPVGSTFLAKYEQNLLVENIQNSLSDGDYDVGGQDALIRMATQVDTVLSAILTVLPGFSYTTVRDAVRNVILTFINSLGLGDDVEISDIQAAVRQVTGVDNFVFVILDRVGGTGNADVIIQKSEFARISSGNITLT